jgi:hypothetical protein
VCFGRALRNLSLPLLSAAVIGSQAVYSYILAPQGLAAGDSVLSGSQASIRPGNTLPLKVSKRNGRMLYPCSVHVFVSGLAYNNTVAEVPGKE